MRQNLQPWKKLGGRFSLSGRRNVAFQRILNKDVHKTMQASNTNRIPLILNFVSDKCVKEIKDIIKKHDYPVTLVNKPTYSLRQAVSQIVHR